MKRFLASFLWAFKGIVYAFKTQLNFKIYCILAILVIILGVYVNLTSIEWVFITIAMGLVIIVELINTAIEVMVDLISPQKQLKAGAIKDIAAAAVLLSAVVAFVIGLFVFIPKFI